MELTLTAPACLLLGVVAIDGRPHQLGIALQHPPIQLVARSSALLLITGGRADLASRLAEHALGHYRLPPQAEIEIELAIPSFMGLGSAGMLGMSMARALAELHGLPAGDTGTLAEAAGLSHAEALEAHAFAGGGLLLIDPAGQCVRRQPIAHAGEDDAWVWVMVLPRVPAGTPPDLEAGRRADLLAAARYLSDDSGRACQERLFPAAEQNDFAAFARALAEIQHYNADALRLAEQQQPLTDHEQKLIEIMQAHGALACGRAPGGLALVGLIRGAGPSRELRHALAGALGLFGGTAMASICANHGASLT